MFGQEVGGGLKACGQDGSNREAGGRWWGVEMKVKMNPTSLPEPELEGESLLIHFLRHLYLPLLSLHPLSKWKVTDCEQERSGREG